MIDILRKIFGLHEHKWREVTQHPVVDNKDSIPACIIIVSKCEICGVLKNHKIKY